MTADIMLHCTDTVSGHKAKIAVGTGDYADVDKEFESIDHKK